MKKTIVILSQILLIIFVLPSFGQVPSLNITRCQSGEEVIMLVDSVLLNNVNSLFKKNITFNGDPGAVGYYRNGSFLGQASDEGVIFSTGFADDLDKSNNCAPQNASGNTGGAGDPDLQQVSGYTINDACVIEFEIMPSGNSILLSYIFGSEEYHDYVYSFNDAFGYFLSGPGIDGPYSNNAEIISTVPGSNQPVAINNLNCGNHAAGCDVTLPGGPNCELLVDNSNTSNNGFDQVALDAYTTTLPANHQIQSFEWYHIKIAIGDAVDAAFDSGLFMCKGSVVNDSIITYISPGLIANNFQFTPNPAHDYIQILELNPVQILEYFIYDINGRLLKRAPFENNKISLKRLSKGILILKISTDKGMSRHRIVHL